LPPPTRSSVPFKPDAQVARECAENFRTKDLVAV
jgi:hypothetical protein